MWCIQKNKLSGKLKEKLSTACKQGLGTRWHFHLERFIGVRANLLPFTFFVSPQNNYL
jgi:hypothetical protein